MYLEEVLFVNNLVSETRLRLCTFIKSHQLIAYSFSCLLSLINRFIDLGSELTV